MMKRLISILCCMMLLLCAASAEESITLGTQTQRGFVNDNVLHSAIGDIHFSSYIPASYDGSEPYALLSPCRDGKGCTFRASARIWWRTSGWKPSATTKR